MPIAPALWFLPCMFFTSIVYSLLSHLCFMAKACIIAAITTLGMVYSSLSDIMLPFAVEPISVALGFMLVGELIKKKQKTVIKWLDNHWLVLFLLMAEAVLAMLNRSVDMRSARYHNCILYIINSIAGTMAYWGIARKIDVLQSNKAFRLLIHQASFLSRNSMGFICMNQFFILLLELLFQQLMFDGTFVLMIDKMAIFVLVMIVISLLTHVIMHSKCRIFLGAR